ncbi:MAG: 3-hydroxyacyl-CoA dehydrogenase family protein [Planktomarina sp.]
MTTQLSLAAGYQVILVGADQAQTVAVRDQINNIWDRQLAQGILTADAHAARGDALKVSTTLSDAKACDIFIDTTHRGHAAIAEVAKPGAVLALTSLPTGTLDVQSRRDDTVVLRFAAPLSRNPLVEVAVEHIETSPALPMAISFVQGLGKTPIPTGITSIALGASLRAAMRYAAMELLCLGASPAQVDGAMRAFGFDQGVFQTIDQTGMEAAANLHLVAGLGQHPQSVQIPLLQTLLDAGMAGQRSGAGFYVYPDEGASQPNDAVGPHVAALRAELGYAPRQVKAGEIARRIWIALCNCGAELIAQGVAPDADTIDAIMVLGHGYPIRRGGPMASAEWAGLIQVVRDLKLLSGDNPFWTPSSAMLAANLDGQRFGRKSLQQNA